LRIQSVTNHSCSESTRTFLYVHQRISTPFPSFSLQNVIVTCLLHRQFPKPESLENHPRKPADHVSLSSHIQLSKNRRAKQTGKNPKAKPSKTPNASTSRDQTETRSPISSRQSHVVFSRTKDIVASSAAALVSERFIVLRASMSQQAFLKKCHFSPMPCGRMLIA
jgi:hypothetical protein